MLLLCTKFSIIKFFKRYKRLFLEFSALRFFDHKSNDKWISSLSLYAEFLKAERR